MVPQARVSWSSPSPAVSVDTTGRAVAHASTGPVTVTASSRGVTGTAGVVVQQRGARLVPVPSSLRFASLGDAATLQDTAFDAHDSIIAPHTTGWTSDNPGVASVTSGGRVTAIANGSTKIRGTLDAAAESVTVDVVQAARSVTVTPALVTVRAVIAPVSFHAAVRDANGSLIPGAGLVWQSLATGIAQIVSAAGDSVRIRGVAEGTATIDARSGAGGGSANGTAQVVVRFKLDSLRVAPANPKFNRLGDTLTFTASGTDSLGSTIANPQVSWISRAPARLTIDAVTGLARALDTGNVIFVVATHDNAADSSHSPPWGATRCGSWRAPQGSSRGCTPRRWCSPASAPRIRRSGSGCRCASCVRPR
ncbi:MAG: hypothetical protein DMD74_08875 [Gemmatimonadetes bacterium]|nr:MAG: hypothetical protein DMD74_08875 [Gemmatimonadota bacterium]